MPDGRSDDARKCHRQHEFPGKIHDLINADARERATQPDVNEKQRAQLREKPDIGRDKFETLRGRMPTAKEQSRRKPADSKHAKVFGHEKRRVFETGIFSHVAGNNFRFALGHIERSAVRFHETGHKKQM